MRLATCLLVTACHGLTGPSASRPPDPFPPSPRSSPAPSQASGPIDIAVTVDDLPVHGPLVPGTDRVQIAERMLEAFRRHHLPPVTGFVNGGRLVSDPLAEAVLRRWLAAGNPLGNHTFSHLSLLKAALPDYLADVEKGEEILRRLVPDATAWKTFRYPFLFEGDTVEKRNGVRRYLGEHGYALAEVSIEADDWAFNEPFARCAGRDDATALGELHRLFVAVHVEEMGHMRELTRRLAGRDVRHVLLLHIGVADADALDDLLTAYERGGARWIDLRTALADPFYAQDPAVLARSGAAFPYVLARARGVSASPPIVARDLERRLAATCRQTTAGG